VNITAEEVAEICAWDRNEPRSDIDSVTGGISSGEEFELDRELEGSRNSEGELGPGGGDSHMKVTGVLVGKLELNPYKGDQSGRGSGVI